MPSALTLVLAEEYLKGLIPPVVVGQLTPCRTASGIA
ncbi:transcriptional regulator-like protein [Halomonas sp. GFAJ-1]|nr:transcriptional regulator-like protein [Halomonas sp. GFAJ-1]